MPSGTRSGLTSSSQRGQTDIGRSLAVLGSVLLGAVALLLYQSALWLPQVPLAAKIGLGVFLVLAFARPSQALLIVAGLAPIAVVISPRLGLTPVRGAEALALAVIAGWYSRGGGARQGFSDPLMARASLLFGLIVVGSWLEDFTPQALTPSGPQTPAATLIQFFTTQYLGPSTPEGLLPCALLVTGVALAYATSGMSRQDARLPQQLVRMTVAGSMGAAALSLFRTGAALARSTDPVDILQRMALGQVRLSQHVPDVNAAGSYFVLISVLALGLAATARRAWPWIAAWAISVVALFISGSQAAIFAGAAVTGAGLAFTRWSGFRPFPHRAALVTGAALSLLVLIFVIAQPRQAASSLQIRYQFTETSARMIASSPVFGVGLNRYIAQSSQFMPRELRRMYRRENAHNYFLQVAAELGIIGGILFGVLVFVPLVRAVRALRRMAADPVLLGVTGGLTAFVITCLSGHPLLLAQVAYPFWILLGLTSGIVLRARDAAAETSGIAEAPSRLVPVATWAAATLAILLVISLPIRVHSALRNTSFSGVSYGFHDWELDSRGQRFRWTTDQATFYVQTGVRTIEIPLRAWNPTSGRSTSVQVDVNGRRVNQLDIDHTNWTTVVLKLPPRAPDRSWRIDLRVNPASRPDRIDPRSIDDRLLGVRVGEIQLTPDPDKRVRENRSDK